MRYTKGPWRATKSELGGWGVIAVDPMRGRIDSQLRGMTEADAKLIATAPEMAHMLLSMYSHISHGGPTREEAETLLRKAGVIE